MKLFPVARSPWRTWVDSVLPEIGKSFLVLFCKKEQLPSA
jgi:hypothetical protein